MVCGGVPVAFLLLPRFGLLHLGQVAKLGGLAEYTVSLALLDGPVNEGFVAVLGSARQSNLV